MSRKEKGGKPGPKIEPVFVSSLSPPSPIMPFAVMFLWFRIVVAAAAAVLEIAC